jgi:transposase
MLRQEGTRLPPRALSSQAGWMEVFHAGFRHDHVLSIVQAYHSSFTALTKSIQELDRELAQRERKNPQATRLKTMPKVGRIASLTFLAAVDDVHRFPSSRKLVGYSGLAPTVRASGERTEYGSISREGRAELRAVWVQVAHQVAVDRRRESQPLRSWFARVAKRRGKKTAVVALARRLLVIAYHLLREDTNYNPARLKRRAA